jgi:hypothetical protein
MKARTRNEILREAAHGFVEKARNLSFVTEIGIVGSVAGNDPYAGDLDLAIVLSSFQNLEILAKYARQMSSTSHEWEVFVFSAKLDYKGRICHRRECAKQSAECFVPGCGSVPHLMIIHDVVFDERMFFESPIDVIYSTHDESILLNRSRELGIGTVRTYPVLKAIRTECVECGGRFIIDQGEQKWFLRRGMDLPKRCEKCRLARAGFLDTEDDCNI